MSARYRLTIGSKNTSSWSLRPWLAMKMAKLPFEEVLIRLRRPETKGQILPNSPSGKVPALRIEEDGQAQTVWDSLAICETLAERHPEAKLWPDDANERAEARSYAAEMHSGFPDLRDQLTMDFARTLPTPVLREATSQQIARILSAWSEALKKHDGGFLFGRFSIADCMYAPVVSRFLTYGIDLPPLIADYCARMMALPAMQDWKRAAQAEIEAGLA